MKIPFAAQFYEDDSKQFSAQRCHNMFINVADSEGTKNVLSLEGTPGREGFILLSPDNGEGIRGIYRAANNRFFAVCGDTLFEIEPDGTAVKLGVLNTVTGEVDIADNGIVLNIVDGTDGYFYNFNDNTFNVITDPDFPNVAYNIGTGGVTKVLYIDSYFIWSSNGTQLFWVSANNAFDPNDCIGFDFGSVESNPDFVTTQIKSGENIYFFGENTIEPWYNSGSSIFPFTVRKGAEIEIGTIAPNSVAQILNSVYFLGSSKDGYGIIYQLSGFSIKPISTKAISTFLGKESNDARAWTYSENGNYFYAITIVSLDVTFCYCITSGKWFELSRPNTTGTYKRMNISYQEFWNGQNYVADSATNQIWKWSKEFLDDDGERITRDIILPSVFQENRRFLVDSVEIFINNAPGTITGDIEETNPQLEMFYSKNGGRSFDGWESLSMGKIGEYNKRLKYRSKGSARDFTVRFRSNAKVKQEWIDCFATIRATNND
jgi:hypothetical protein